MTIKQHWLRCVGVLAPSGFFICSFPTDKSVEFVDEEQGEIVLEERIRRFGQNDYKRIFGMQADKILIDAGYDVEVINGETYPTEILPFICPADYDMNWLFCCRKEASE